MDLSQFPRQRLAHLPTPLESLDRLSDHLGGPGGRPRILVKRDDCTGLGLGGNKTRKLEFLLGEAVVQGADSVITTGGVQSNHARQTAAAAAKLGLSCELLLTRVVPWDDADYEATGNAQLDRLLGAKVHLLPGDSDRGVAMAERAEALRAAGGRPYIIPTGGSNGTGALGYVNAALELVQQLNERSLSSAALVHACSSGGTQSGLTAGLAALNHPMRVIGIDVDANPEAVEAEVIALTEETLSRLGLPADSAAERIEVVSGYSGTAYGLPTAEMREAVELAARLEGLVLDPVYSGKALAGLIGLIRAGRCKDDDCLVFLHSGGSPALFAYRSVFDRG